MGLEEYGWDGDERDDDIVFSQDWMTNNGVHKSTQSPPSTFYKIRLGRKIMTIHFNQLTPSLYKERYQQDV